MRKLVVPFAIAVAAVASSHTSPALAAECDAEVQILCYVTGGVCDDEDCLVCIDQLPGIRPICPIN